MNIISSLSINILKAYLIHEYNFTLSINILKVYLIHEYNFTLSFNILKAYLIHEYNFFFEDTQDLILNMNENC